MPMCDSVNGGTGRIGREISRLVCFFFLTEMVAVTILKESVSRVKRSWASHDDIFSFFYYYFRLADAAELTGVLMRF